MNLSKFKGGRLVKFVQGVYERVRDNKIDGEIEFYALNKEIISSMANARDNSKTDLEFMYSVIPVISNVKLDVTVKEFEEMLDVPTKQFALFIDELMDIIEDFKESAEVLNSTQTRVNKLIEQLPSIDEEPIKTKEEQIEELCLVLFNVKDDKVKRTEILNKIKELESDVNG